MYEGLAKTAQALGGLQIPRQPLFLSEGSRKFSTFSGDVVGTLLSCRHRVESPYFDEKSSQ